MADAALAHNIFALHALTQWGHTLPRGADLLTGGVPCYGVYATSDGRWLAVAEEQFLAQGFTDGGQLNAATPQKVGEWVGADGLFYATLVNFSFGTLAVTTTSIDAGALTQGIPSLTVAFNKPTV